MRAGLAAAIGAGICLGAALEPARADDLSALSALQAVTLYPDGAGVTRTIEADLPAGTTTLVAGDFPAGLDPASLRLADLSSGVTLEGLSTQPLAGQASDTRQRELQDLQDRRRAIEAAQAAHQAKQALIERVARGGGLAQGSTGAASGETVMDSAEALRAVWNAVGEDLAAVNETIRQNELKLREIDRQIARLGEVAGDSRVELRATLTVERPVKTHLAVTYRIEGAGWAPAYEARLDTGSGTLTLVRRARIWQQTGEDWHGAALTLSTARPASGAAVPPLETSIVRFEEAPPLPVPMAEARVFKTEPAPPVAAAPRERNAMLDTAGVQASWTVPGRTTLPPGPATQLVRLAEFHVPPALTARVAPALATTAFLEAGFPEPDPAPLLAGPVSIFRDGLYAGESSLPRVAQGEPVRLGFGADDRIAVTRTIARQLESDAGPGRRSERREFRIALRNGRPDAVTIAVEEAVPVSETGEIRVDLLPGTTPPTTRDADERRGVLVWRRDLAPGATSEIRLAYRVSWPEKKTVSIPD